MYKLSNIIFYGGGAWGQALSITLASAGYSSKIVVSNKIRANEINSQISKKFPDIKLSKLISSTNNNIKAIENADLAFITTESKRVIDVVNEINNFKKKNIALIITSKGFATDEGHTFSEVITKKFPKLLFGILTGPTFADEVAHNLPAAALLASHNKDFANAICQLFSNSCLRLYQSDDPIGASIAGAIKNIIAIGAGICQGLNLGDNAKAALITRGLSETSRLIKASGGNFSTAFGLAGIGDMSLTCSGPHSRNMAYGISIAKQTINVKQINLVEGVYAISAAIRLSKKLNIELPIVNSINQIINHNGNVKEIVNQLLSRPLKEEF